MPNTNTEPDNPCDKITTIIPNNIDHSGKPRNSEGMVTQHLFCDSRDHSPAFCQIFAIDDILI